ncbi:MAG: hypothetical protein VYD19_08410, partial [Myxococcota bacterium]|nr:hypothetical protein [Myxococcota bacterium]
EDRRRLRDRVSDPKETFVETTTCASCHRLAEKRFDFHSFSYLEDEEATITPRVIQDTKNDIEIARRFLESERL